MGRNKVRQTNEKTILNKLIMDTIKSIRQKGGTDKIMNDIRRGSVYCSNIIMPETSGIKISDGIPPEIIYPVWQSPLISSEFTAITQYMGDESTFDEFSDALSQIGIIEMSHFDFLGDAIDKLGGDKNQYWDNSNIRRFKTKEALILWNIEGEIAARNAYEDLASKINSYPNSETKDILLRGISIAIEDELIHERALRVILSGL